MSVAEKQEAIYLEYYPKIRRYIAAKLQDPQTAEDLVSEVFLKVCQRLESFDESRASLSTWIYTIAKNTVIDHYRTSRHHSELPEALASGEDLEESLCRADTLQALAAALEALDERQRDIIILRYYRGMTLREIAQRMGLSYSYMKALHNSALASLKRKLG